MQAVAGRQAGAFKNVVDFKVERLVRECLPKSPGSSRSRVQCISRRQPYGRQTAGFNIFQLASVTSITTDGNGTSGGIGAERDRHDARPRRSGIDLEKLHRFRKVIFSIRNYSDDAANPRLDFSVSLGQL